MVGRFFALFKSFEERAVQHQEIEPGIVVVIVEGDTAAGGLEEISIFVFVPKNGFGVEAGLASNVDEADAQFARRCGRRFESFPCGERSEARPAWPRERQDLLQWQYNRRTTQRFKKGSP